MTVGRENAKHQWFTCSSWERIPYVTGIVHVDRVMGFGKYARMRYQDTPLSYRVSAKLTQAQKLLSLRRVLWQPFFG
eukprot:6327990-Amphidinium_carterae.2